MINKQSRKNVYIVWALFLLFAGLLSGWQTDAFAEERVYTNVLADLQKDETFTVINYPENETDYAIRVIQIAESDSGELFLYTYQPCNKTRKLTATDINMSLSESVDGTSLFPLTLLNTNGVFCKYLVNGVAVSDEAVRYYNITSIYRDWIVEIDGETGNDNTGNSKAFSVGKLYKAETQDGETKYSCENVDVITILNPYVDFLRYNDGLKWDFIFNASHYTDVHYIAFDTDFPIDTLQEADISYITQPYMWQSLGKGYTYGEKSEPQYLPLTGEQTGGNEGDGFLGVKYTWKRIQSTKDFVKSVDLIAASKEAVEKTKWVLIFLETPFTRSEKGTLAGHQITETGTKVSNVTILRLKFVTAGTTYNLGTVSDKLTGDDIPGGGAHALGWLDLLCKWLEQITGLPAWVWKIIICLLPFVILLPILSAVFPIVGQILAAVFKGIATAFVWLCKGIWWLVCLPFRGIAALINAIKDKKEGGSE